jgi:RecB family exonuclease
MTDEIRIRPSEIKLFRRCRRQWEIKYLHGIGLKDEGDTSEPGAASVGTLVHEALACYYKTGYAGDTQADTDDGKLAGIMVDGYLEWLEETGADDGFKIEGAEIEMEVPWPHEILGDQVVLVGHIDLLATDPWGRINLIDHKTVQGLEQYARQLAVDSQMLTYALMLKLKGVEVHGAIHNALRRVKRTAASKPPYYQRNVVTYNTDQLRNHFHQLHATFEDMVRCRRAVELRNHYSTYPSPSRDCTWDCPHIAICPAFDDGSDINGILEAMKNAV